MAAWEGNLPTRLLGQAQEQRGGAKLRVVHKLVQMARTIFFSFGGHFGQGRMNKGLKRGCFATSTYESHARSAAACVISNKSISKSYSAHPAAICPSAPCRIMAKLPHQFVSESTGPAKEGRSLSSWSLFVLLFHANLPCLDSFGHRQISGTEHAFKGPQSGNSLLLSGMSHRIWLVGCPRSTSLTLNLAKTGPEQAELTITNVLNTARVEGCKMQTSTRKTLYGNRPCRYGGRCQCLSPAAD